MKKRILGMLVLLVLLMSAMPASAEIIDVHGTKYEKAVQLLCDIGILESVSPSYFKPEDAVTRSDAARFIAALSGIRETEAKEVFSDVPSSHPHFTSIYLAYQLGLISGVGDGSFNPDGEILGEQAAKMLVTLAGYKAHAEAAGGYPGGYLSKANQLGILDGVSMATPFSKGNLALMMYNTLFVIPAEKASYGDADGSFISEGENFLARFLGIETVEGLVSANCYTSISGERTREGEIAVNGETYIAPAALAQTVGRELRIYYKVNEQEEKEIVSFASLDKTSALRLRAEDILPETTKNTLYYQRDEDAKKNAVSLEKDYILYNGSILSPFEAADLQPLQGTVTLWETASGKVTLAAVEAYTDFIVKNVLKEDSILYFEDNEQKKESLDLSDTKVRFNILDADGKPIAMQNITAGMVVSVMESRDKKVCTLMVSGDTVSGVITEKTEKSVIVAEKEYDFSPAFSETLPDVGKNVALSLNYQGSVVKTAANVTGRNYGYLMKGEYEGKGLSRVGKIKLLTAEDNVKVFSASEKFSINDVVIGGGNLFNKEAVLSDAQSAELRKIYQGGKVVEQLIVYEVNEKEEITSVVTAADRTKVLDRDQSIFSLNYESEGDMFIAYSLRAFASRYYVPENAIVFSVADHYTEDNDDQYMIKTGAAIEHSNTYPQLKLYDLSEENAVSVMVTKMKVSDTDTYISNAVLVKEIITTITEDGMPCEAVRVIGRGGAETILYNSEDVQAMLKNENAQELTITNKKKDPICVENGGKLPTSMPLSKLEPGDIIKYTTEGDALKNVIVCLRGQYGIELEKGFRGTLLYSPSADDDYRESLWAYSKQLIYAGKTGFRFMATGTTGVKMERFHTYGAAPILIFDKAKKTVKVGSKDALTSGVEFFVSRYNSAEQLIVVYK